MDDKKRAVPKSTVKPRALLKRSEKSLEDVMIAVDAHVEGLKIQEASTSELSKTITAFSRIRGQLHDEVTIHEKRVLLSQGKLAESMLDFDEIRDEIGRCLDRLRKAAASEDVSEGTDE